MTIGRGGVEEPRQGDDVRFGSFDGAVVAEADGQVDGEVPSGGGMDRPERDEEAIPGVEIRCIAVAAPG